MGRISRAEAQKIAANVDRKLAEQRKPASAPPPPWAKPQAHLPKGKK